MPTSADAVALPWAEGAPEHRWRIDPERRRRIDPERPRRIDPERPRRIDPERPRRIVEAALHVASDRGVEGLRHRAAAEAVDVPLGSTTYHFKDKDELLASVVALARERNGVMLGELLARHLAVGDLTAGLAAMVE